MPFPSPPELEPTELARTLETFFAEHPHAAILEDGRVIFDMRQARYSLSTEHGRCVLQLWSEERNIVRTLVGFEARKTMLRLASRRFGQNRPVFLELVADQDRRTPSTRNVERKRFLRMLERVIERDFPDLQLAGLTQSSDLEHSFGPGYARGVLKRGRSAWAVLAVSADESGAIIDGALTLGILWLDLCRKRCPPDRVFEGLKLIVPAGSSARTLERIGWLHTELAKWELYTLDPRSEELERLETGRNGNVDVQLAHAFDRDSALERFREPVSRLLGQLPAGMSAAVEVRPTHPGEISFRLHGLEFARVRHGLRAGTFQRADEVTFGTGPHETALNAESEALFRELMERIFASRSIQGAAHDPVYRLQSERWLESVLRKDLTPIEPGIRPDHVYTQVPAFASGDRGMLDLLSVTRSGRLVVLELKADEDLHLPLQGLDYWLRVRQLAREPGAFARAGYFRGVELSGQPPMLHFVAPALRIHPANETVLRCLKPEIEWEIIALGEDWRVRPRVIFRKHALAPGLTLQADASAAPFVTR